MDELSNETCVPCTTDVPALERAELARLQRQIPGWELIGGHHLKEGFRFGNLREALDFVNRVGELAEEQGHHPDVSSGWDWAYVTIFTHRIDGLTVNDSSSRRRWIGSSSIEDTPGLNQPAAGTKLGTIRNRSGRKEPLWRSRTPSKLSGCAR